MNEEEKRLEIQIMFVKADKWLNSNGKFKRELIEQDGYESGFRISFQMDGDKKPLIMTGTDIINLTLQMYAEVE
ncbi:hypothetical protein [Winogradskyella sp.]|uniref:hypothetical protein n=1 Tax=Winogradskyella sp. TaxID=1883156 RepID=UPI003AB91573